jgi:hypothetical protein
MGAPGMRGGPFFGGVEVKHQGVRVDYKPEFWGPPAAARVLCHCRDFGRVC